MALNSIKNNRGPIMLHYAKKITRKKSTLLRAAAGGIIALLLIVGGLYFWSQRSDPGMTGTQNELAKTYIDTAHIFSFQYPATWKAINPPHCCEGPAPDPAVTPSVVNLIYPKAPRLSTSEDTTSKNDITVIPSRTKDRRTAYNETFDKAQRSTLHGYEKLVAKTTERYGYQDHLFLLSDGKYDIVFRFRAKQTTKAGLGGAAFDNTYLLPQLQEVVNSVRFK
jgi:hypothetical protein